MGSRIVALALLLWACPREKPPRPEPIVRVELSPSRLMLTPDRPSARLVVRAFDAVGAEVQGASVAWSVSDEAIARVDPDGTVTAVGPTGSTALVATVEGVSSAPALVLRATPAAGAVLVDDAQVVGDPVELDAPESFGVGWSYRVTLAQVAAPPVGAVLMSSGEKPVAGRVVASREVPEGVEVTLALLPLDELFEALVLHARLPLVAPPASPQALTQVGPFECSSTIEANLLSLSLPQSTYTAKVDFIVDYDRARAPGDRLREFRIEGALDVDAVVALTLNAAVSGELECLLEITSFPIPGALLPVFGGNVPVGVGMSMSVSTTIANVGGQLRFKEHYAVNEGFVCAGGPDSCVLVHSPQHEVTGALEPVVTLPLQGYRAEVAMFGFAFAKLSFGVPWIKKLRFDALEAKAGIRGVLDVAPRARQVAEPEYHSGITLSLHGEAEAAASIQRLKDLLNVKFLNVNASVDVVLDHVPKGTFTATPSEVEPGGRATLTVELEPHTALQAMRVEVVRAQGGTLTTACSIPQTASAQTRYSCELTLPDEGRHVFYAFVDTAADGSGITMELGDDAPVMVQVGPDLDALTNLALRFGPISRTVTSTGQGCGGDTVYPSSSYFLHAEHGAWTGTTWNASWDREYPPGSFGGHRRETAAFAATFDATRSLLLGFDLTHVMIGYEDDAENTTTREETTLRWVGPSIPSVAPLLGQVDFKPDVALTPAVLRFGSVRSGTWTPCVNTLTAWSADPSYSVLLLGFSP